MVRWGFGGARVDGGRPVLPTFTPAMMSPVMNRFLIAFVCAPLLLLAGSAVAADADSVTDLWPGDPPTWNAPEGPEGDKSGPDGRDVAGKSVIRLGDVSTPQLHAYPVGGAKTTVIVCPGGGFSILAWDLEGTEIAQWFQQRGVSAAVLKYRVPTRGEDQKWKAPVQDVQRSIALIRSGAIKSLPAGNVGILGFSAGGHTVARAALADERLYDSVDKNDAASIRPDFAALVYPAYLIDEKESEQLSSELVVTEQSPPMFFAHAFDDRISCLGSVALFAELKRKNVPSSLHIFSTGGHGFGARDTSMEKDHWMPLVRSWLQDRGF